MSKQQDRGNVHRPEEEPEQPQRPDTAEPQAVHFWVFLGIDRNSKHEKAGAALIATPAHACRLVQSYSSWSCSPAELHYASDCGAKVQTLR